MDTYYVQFTAWLPVQAKDEDHARIVAERELEKLYGDSDIEIGEVDN